MASRNWREADPRGGHGALPSSVEAVVDRTRLALATTRWAESALIFTAALSVMLAAISTGGDELARLDSWGLAVTGGLLAALSWRIGHHLGLVEVARALDERLRFRGALITALEIERRDPGSPMGRALRSRVLSRLRLGEAIHAVMPPIALPLVAPLAGAGLLAFALERAPGGEELLRVDLAPLVSQLEGFTADTHAAWEEGTLDAATAGELLALRRRLRRLAADLSRSDLDRESTREELERLDRDLVDLGPRIQEEAKLAEALESMRPWLDAARMALEEGEGSGGPGGSGSAGGTESPGGPEASDARSEGPVAAGGSSASPSPVEGGATSAGGSSAPPGIPDAGDPEPGSSAGAWWRAEYDEVVAGWIEYRRARGLDRSSGGD
jgi:hypothetical protein